MIIDPMEKVKDAFQDNLPSVQQGVQKNTSSVVMDTIRPEIQRLEEQIDIQTHVIIMLIEMLKHQKSLSNETIMQVVERVEQRTARTIDEVHFAKSVAWFKTLLDSEQHP